MTLLAGSFNSKELTVFVCNFSRLTSRTDLAGLSGCAGSYAAHQLPMYCSTGDCEDWRRLWEALDARRVRSLGMR